MVDIYIYFSLLKKKPKQTVIHRREVQRDNYHLLLLKQDSLDTT